MNIAPPASDARRVPGVEAHPEAALEFDGVQPVAMTGGTAPQSISMHHLTPAQYACLLHPIGRPRKVALAQKVGGEWRERRVWVADLAAEVTRLAGVQDAYISMQSFYGKRGIERLAQLGCAYVDLDYYNVAVWAGQRPEIVAQEVLEALQEARVPAPGLILSTGRGLSVIWLHSLNPKQALPRWAKMQGHLGNVLARFGPDKNARDAARVFRICGTRNSRADDGVVRVVWMAGSAETLPRWSFDILFDEVMPLTREEFATERARRAEKRAAEKARTAGKRPAPVSKLGGRSYWETVLADLHRLRWHRCADGRVPSGSRNAWVLIAAVAHSWLAPPETAEDEIIALAKEVADWTPQQAKSCAAAVLRKAEQAAKGETVEYRGHEGDPRYWFKVATIIDDLAITPEEMSDAGLRVLINKDVKMKHARQRQEASQRRKGVQSRAAYRVQAREQASVHADDILALYACLGSAKAVADHLGIPKDTAKRRLQRARKIAGQGEHGPSRFMGA